MGDRIGFRRLTLLDGEFKDEGETLQLAVAAFQREMSALSSKIDAHIAANAALPPSVLEKARTEIRARRRRSLHLDANLLADPAWDMMLDLFVARLERREVYVTSLCIAAAVPNTTALRWIRLLTDRGMFVRRADRSDGRRFYIELSDELSASINAYFRDL